MLLHPWIHSCIQVADYTTARQFQNFNLPAYDKLGLTEGCGIFRDAASFSGFFNL